MPQRHAARRRPAVLAALVSLGAIGAAGGCSDGGGAYPSLASRPAERLADTPPDAAAVPVPAAAGDAPAPELAGRLARIADQARGAKRGFDDQQATAERTVTAAGSASAGSEAWARATLALSAMQSARSQTAQPLADLDRLDIDDRLRQAGLIPDQNAAQPDAAAIAQTREMIAGWVAQEDAVLAKLDGRLAR